MALCLRTITIANDKTTVPLFIPRHTVIPATIPQKRRVFADTRQRHSFSTINHATSARASQPRHPPLLSVISVRHPRKIIVK